jgi:hypothetical protein
MGSCYFHMRQHEHPFGKNVAGTAVTKGRFVGGSMLFLFGFVQSGAGVEGFDPKAFDAAVSLAQSLTQWDF